MKTQRWLRGGIAVAWLAAAGWLLPAPAPAGAAEPAPAAVHIRNFKFDPETLEVPAGTAVSWTNDDEELHAIFAVDGSFRSPGIDGSETYTRQFTAPGTYEYRCSLHPHMVGKIVVR